MKGRLRICLLMQGGLDWAGGIEYIKNLILALGNVEAELATNLEISLLCADTVKSFLSSQVDSIVVKRFDENNEQEKPTLLNRVRWLVKEKIKGQDFYNHRLDGFLEKGGFDFVYPYNGCSRGRFRFASWVPDLQHKYFKDFFSREEIGRRERIYSFMAKNAPIIVTSSEAVKRDFCEFYPLAEPKVRTLPFKVYPDPAWYEENPEFYQTRYNLPDRFFIVTNQFWRHKNHLVILDAMRLLKEKSICPAVVFTGNLFDSRDPHYSNQIFQTVHRYGLAHRIFILGMIPKMDQIQLMRRSLAVIQPSLFEGWSTVVEEARCLGKTVILSDIPVHREQNPEAGIFFKARSSESLVDILRECWEGQPPGPDFDREERARERILSEVKEFGKKFLRIVYGNGQMNN